MELVKYSQGDEAMEYGQKGECKKKRMSSIEFLYVHFPWVDENAKSFLVKSLQRINERIKKNAIVQRAVFAKKTSTTDGKRWEIVASSKSGVQRENDKLGIVGFHRTHFHSAASASRRRLRI